MLCQLLLLHISEFTRILLLFLKGREPLRHLQPGEKPCVQSPVVNTIFSFVDRQRTEEVTSESTTDTALAELYAQVQAMPESAQKKRLIAKLNDANGYGTPKILKPLSSRTHANVSETLENFKSWITPRNPKKTTSNIHTGGSHQKGSKKEKIGRTGSYSLKQKKHCDMVSFDEKTAPHSFKRCISEQQEGSSSITHQTTYMGTPTLETMTLKEKMSNSKVRAEKIEKGVPCIAYQEEENKIDTFDLQHPPSISTKSAQKRPPPPVPPRVSSLKPRRETPKLSTCELHTKDNKTNSIALTPGASSTPLTSGLFGLIVII